MSALIVSFELSRPFPSDGLSALISSQLSIRTDMNSLLMFIVLTATNLVFGQGGWFEFLSPLKLIFFPFDMLKFKE